MDETGYEDIDSEETHQREIDDEKYENFPLDWDPETDLLESFEPNLRDKTFDINSSTFKRKDGLDLRSVNVRKRVVEELTGAKISYRTKGFSKGLFDNLTFDEDNKSILYGG